LAVAQLFAITTLEVGVTNRSGALLLLWSLLLTAGGRWTSGRAPVFESLESKIQSIDFLVEAVGRSVGVSWNSRGRR
jgi:hypothetical protein